MIDAGALHPIRFSARSHLRFRTADVERLLARATTMLGLR
jgi:hypothetical protein